VKVIYGCFWAVELVAVELELEVLVTAASADVVFSASFGFSSSYFAGYSTGLG
jgi:hypothetical protein